MDIKAGGFWSKGVNAFFDVRVTHLNSKTNQNKTTNQIFKSHEMEKKRHYHQRIIEVEQGHFTPLVFGTNGVIGVEGSCFLKSVMTWLRTRLSFEIIKSVHVCIRGSRTPFKTIFDRGEMMEDFELNLFNAGV